jgi:hypothetical protein
LNDGDPATDKGRTSTKGRSMASRNPLAKITHAAQGAANLPLKATEKVADRAVGVVAGGMRIAASLVSSTAGRAKSLVGTEDQKNGPARTDAPVGAAPMESVEELAEAAVAREMAEEPRTTPTPSKAARATAPTRAAKPKKGGEPVDEPLIDPATAKAVKSETDILRAAADRGKDL